MSSLTRMGNLLPNPKVPGGPMQNFGALCFTLKNQRSRPNLTFIDGKDERFVQGPHAVSSGTSPRI